MVGAQIALVCSSIVFLNFFNWHRFSLNFYDWNPVHSQSAALTLCNNHASQRSGPRKKFLLELESKV